MSGKHPEKTNPTDFTRRQLLLGTTALLGTSAISAAPQIPPPRPQCVRLCNQPNPGRHHSLTGKCIDRFKRPSRESAAPMKGR
jgi:hypothetical protein